MEEEQAPVKGERMISEKMDQLINVEKTLIGFGGDKSMLKELLYGFDGMSVIPVFAGIAAAWEKRNWTEIKRHSHSLKGSSSYLHADFLINSAKACQDAAGLCDENSFLKFYPLMATETLRMKRAVADILFKSFGIHLLYLYILLYIT